MKKLLIALAGAACLFTQLPAKADQLQDIEKRGTIRIAVPQDFPPFGSVGPTCSRRATTSTWRAIWPNR
jgi:polar amino acid transport system substrate-binding protein